MINTISKTQPLSFIIMPLVRVMATDGLSWSDRERISEAIAACVRHSEQMEKERAVSNQAVQGVVTGYGQAGYQPGSNIG